MTSMLAGSLRGAPSELAAAEAGAFRILRERKVAVMIVAYDAERHIEQVLARIPPSLAGLLAEIYVLDDASRDRTSEKAAEAAEALGLKNVKVFRTPVNRGYGGNQKIGYRYAVERGFDFVVMLHGDGQYPPEHLPQLIAAFADDGVDAVLGSRMLRPRDALRGGMPVYKWIGNRLLTAFENRVLGVELSEFHTGYRGYRVSTLGRIPFKFGSDDFHFDTEILIQLLSAGCRIAEVPIPTHYGDEVCHVNGLRYTWDCVKAVVKYRLFRMGLFFNPLLDFNLFETENYFYKKAPNSLHQYVLRHPFVSRHAVLDLGAAAGYVSAAVAERAGAVMSVDFTVPRHAGRAEARALDLDGDFDVALGPARFDIVLALDVIEHLEDPEAAVQKIARVMKSGGTVLASTANIAFMVMRVMLALGVFNYGKRGILDRTHKRLFTVYSFAHLFRTYGFRVELVRGFGPPIRDLVSDRGLFVTLDTLSATLARWMPRLFSYNFLIVATRLPSLEEMYEGTVLPPPVSKPDHG